MSFSYREASFKAILQHIWHSPTFTTWGSLSVNILRIAVLLPFTLNRLSAEENSIWLLFMSMLSMAYLADLGFSPTFTRMIALALGGITSFKDLEHPQPPTTHNPNWHLIEKLYGTLGIINSCLTALAVLVMATVGSYAIQAPLSKLSHSPTLYWQAWAVLCFTIGVIFYGKKYETVLMGMGKVALVNRWNIVMGLCSVSLSVTVLALGGNILHLFLALGVSSIANALRNQYLVRYHIENGLFRNFKSFVWDKALFKIAFSPSWKLATMTLFSIGLNEYTNVLYAQVANVAALATYQFAFRMMTQVSEFSKAPFYSKLPEFTRLVGKGDRTTLTHRAEKSMQLALLLFVIGALGIGFGAKFGLQVIQSKVQFPDARLWLLMSWVLFWERHYAMHTQLYMLNTLKANFYTKTILTGSLNGLLMYSLLDHLGMWTFPVAHGVSNMVISNWYFVKLSLPYLQRNPWEYLLKSVALPLGIFIVGSLLLLLAAKYAWV